MDRYRRCRIQAILISKPRCRALCRCSGTSIGPCRASTLAGYCSRWLCSCGILASCSSCFRRTGLFCHLLEHLVPAQLGQKIICLGIVGCGIRRSFRCGGNRGRICSVRGGLRLLRLYGITDSQYIGIAILVRIILPFSHIRLSGKGRTRLDAALDTYCGLGIRYGYTSSRRNKAATTFNIVSHIDDLPAVRGKLHRLARLNR